MRNKCRKLAVLATKLVVYHILDSESSTAENSGEDTPYPVTRTQGTTGGRYLGKRGFPQGYSQPRIFSKPSWGLPKDSQRSIISPASISMIDPDFTWPCPSLGPAGVP